MPIASASPTGQQPKIVGLSLRLLREGRTPETALRPEHELNLTECSVGTLYTGQSPATPPGWASFFRDIAPSVGADLRSQSCSAILFVETAQLTKRLFALCFGQGHHALEENAIERGFGLKVTLNCVARDSLKTIDSAALDSTVMQRRTQASRNADLRAFQIDTDNEIIRLASGSPAASDFARALSGRDALSLRASIVPTELVERCERALELYGATTYKRDFAFIDHVTPVGDRDLNTELDAIVFRELHKLVDGGASDLHLSIPDILSPDEEVEIGYFGVGLKPGSKTSYVELTIEDYVAELQKGDFSLLADMAALRGSHEIRVITDGQGDREHKRKLYSCFIFETDLRGASYVLFDAQWFLVDGSFYEQVEASYRALLRPSFLPATTAKNERELIEALKQDVRLLCMDQTRANPAGAPRAALECCDFLSASKQLIHLKDGHASSPLSHLWNQALISAESFRGDAKFRADFRQEAIKREKQYGRSGFSNLLPDGRTKPVPADFPIIYGVMRHPTGGSNDINLPFFSKVALRAAAHRLDLMGFPVEVHLIAKVSEMAHVAN